MSPQDITHYYDYPATTWEYFRQVDDRFDRLPPAQPIPHPLMRSCLTAMPDVKAVMWDLYGTLLQITVGDLEAGLDEDAPLERAARETIQEFALSDALTRLAPSVAPPQTLVRLYRAGIEASHRVSIDEGMEYPEVVIEEIWQAIIGRCREEGYQPPAGELSPQTALRCAYFFDRALQRIAFYESAVDCLQTFHAHGLTQGIISNAQFYTPLHLRRLLRAATNDPAADIDSVFDAELLFFSYELGCSKPNPRAFDAAQHILSRHNIRPHEVVYIGNDLLNDVWAADRAGWRTILAAHDADQTRLREDNPTCCDLRPNAVVTNLAALIDLLTAEPA